MTENSKIFDIRKKRCRAASQIEPIQSSAGFSTACKSERRIRAAPSSAKINNGNNIPGKERLIPSRKRISLKATKIKTQIKDFFSTKLGVDINEESLLNSSYEEFLNILKDNITNKLGENSVTPLEVTNEITDIFVTGSDFVNKICSICISTVDFHTRHYLKCGHVYHDECISKWMKFSSLCPNCKGLVTRRDSAFENELTLTEELIIERLIAAELASNSGGSFSAIRLSINEILNTSLRAILLYIFILFSLTFFVRAKIILA